MITTINFFQSILIIVSWESILFGQLSDVNEASHVTDSQVSFVFLLGGWWSEERTRKRERIKHSFLPDFFISSFGCLHLDLFLLRVLLYLSLRIYEKRENLYYNSV